MNGKRVHDGQHTRLGPHVHNAVGQQCSEEVAATLQQVLVRGPLLA